MNCPATIRFDAPHREEKVRGFQPPWRTVCVYICKECGQERRLYKNWSGPIPPGAFRCGLVKAKGEDN